jgi:hypothetical protein
MPKRPARSTQRRASAPTPGEREALGHVLLGRAVQLVRAVARDGEPGGHDERAARRERHEARRPVVGAGAVAGARGRLAAGEQAERPRAERAVEQAAPAWPTRLAIPFASSPSPSAPVAASTRRHTA